MVARELPSDEVLASWQHVEQRALNLRAAGMPGSLQDLRVRAYLDLLQERDSRTVPAGLVPAASTGAGQDQPAPDQPPPHTDPPGPSESGPSLAALVTITIPLTTYQGRSDTPGEADGFGIVDGDDARDLAAAAARHPRTRWCVTALNPDGTAAAHGCLPGRPAPHRTTRTGPPRTGPARHWPARRAGHPADPGRPRLLRPRPRPGRLPPLPHPGPPDPRPQQ